MNARRRKLSHRWSTALVALVMLCTPALARAELSSGPTIPQPPPTFAERERVLWSAPGGAWLQLVSLAITNRTWSFASHWSVVGTAGNRLLWHRADVGETNLWKLDDAGNYVSHVSLPQPAPGFTPRSLTLGNPFVGACFDRGESQRYYVLWTDGVRGMILQYMHADGSAVTSHTVAPFVATEPTAVIAAAASLGTLMLLTHVTPINQPARYELRYLEWSTAQARYVATTVAFTAPLPAGHTPVSLNAASTSTDGWIDQVLLRAPSGAGLLRTIAWGRSSPTPGPFVLNDRSVPIPASGWAARGHIVNPARCPGPWQEVYVILVASMG